MDWEGFYRSEWQGLWALLLAPALFLVYAAGPGRVRAAASRRAAAGFVFGYCVFFALETLADPIATGPLGRWLGLPPGARTALQLCFVLLGDFRVFALVFGLADERRGWWLRALASTAIVPLFAGGVYFGLLTRLFPDLSDQWLWLVYELAFLVLALAFRQRLVPHLSADEPRGHRRFLRRALGYVAVYYGLWAACDLLILANVELGWGLRAIPNQLYYAFWVPFVFASFFRGEGQDRA